MKSEQIRLHILSLVRQFQTLDLGGVYYVEAEEKLLGMIDDAITNYGEACVQELAAEVKQTFQQLHDYSELQAEDE